MNTRARLLSAADPRGLAALGVHEADRPLVGAWLRAVADDPDDLAAVGRLIETVLAPGLGDFDGLRGGAAFPPEAARHRLADGVLPLAALAAFAPEVRAFHLARGVPSEIAGQTLHDLGEQVAKHRRVTGRPGLGNQNWLRGAWSGGLLWIGRLQFELALSNLGADGDPVRVLSVHIPATGPLRSADVDAALAAAAPVFAQCYVDAGAPAAVTCHSWLLDRTLLDLVPGSNLAAFCARWEVWERSVCDRDAYYFGFDIEPPAGVRLPYDLDRLPDDTRLHRAMIAHWRAGGHFTTCTGRLRS